MKTLTICFDVPPESAMDGLKEKFQGLMLDLLNQRGVIHFARLKDGVRTIDLAVPNPQLDSPAVAEAAVETVATPAAEGLSETVVIDEAATMTIYDDPAPVPTSNGDPVPADPVPAAVESEAVAEIESDPVPVDDPPPEPVASPEPSPEPERDEFGTVAKK